MKLGEQLKELAATWERKARTAHAAYETGQQSTADDGRYDPRLGALALFSTAERARKTLAEAAALAEPLERNGAAEFVDLRDFSPALNTAVEAIRRAMVVEDHVSYASAAAQETEKVLDIERKCVLSLRKLFHTPSETEPKQ